MRYKKCYVDPNLGNKITNFFEATYDSGNNDPNYFDIEGFDAGIDHKLVNENKRVEGKVFRYYLDNGIVKEADYLNDDIYIDQQVEKEVAKMKEKLALEEVKKIKPEYADKIDEKLAKL